MAGRPLLTYLGKVIAEQGGDDVIFDRIAAGESVRNIVKDYINPKTGTHFTHPMIYHWIHAGGDEREQLWEEAKAIAAHSHVEEAGEILDEGGERKAITSAEASMVQARAKHKKWLAGVFNRDAYGEEKAQGPNTINIGTLHLSALQQAGSMKALPSDEEEDTPALEAEFEVVEE